MNNRKTVYHLKTTVLRLTLVLALFAVAFVCSGLDVSAENDLALTVKVDGNVAKVYGSVEELLSIPGAAVSSLDYSGYNSYPTFSVKHVDNAIRLDKIVEDATQKNLSEFDKNNTIKFKADDGVSTIFTIEQLFGYKRYYYPNAAAGTDRTGGKALTEAYANAVEVCAVIETEGDNTLMFGQAAPNEQNYPECLKYMLFSGEIEINTATAEKCNPAEAVPADGSTLKDGTEISLPLPSQSEKRTKVFYIVDPVNGEEPGYGCDFYFYSPFNWSDKIEELKKYINPPVINGNGSHILAVKVCAYGKQDSEVTYFRYTVQTDVQPEPAVEPAPAPVQVNKPGKAVITLKPGKKQIKISWKKVEGASGYVIYRSTKKSSGFKAVKTIKKGSTLSYTNKKLKKGKRYYYKVRAYIDVNGKKVFSKYSSVKSAKAK